MLQSFLFASLVLFLHCTNTLFALGQTCDPISFANLDFTLSTGGLVNKLQSPTCIAIGHDQRLYLGTLGGTVQVVTVNRDTLQVTARCYSEPLVNPAFQAGGEPSVRDILGIALDPRDRVIRPYVTTSTRFHTAQSRIDNSPNAAWRNGAVWRLRQGSSAADAAVCLVPDRRIVSNLPVSNENHAVNDLLFSQDGDLLIAVGGSTNMGLPGFRLGNFWESPLSAAVLVARLSRRRFRGRVRYASPSRPFLARQTGGDVSVFASGLRNPFTLAMDAAGSVYAVDQSSNCDFGNVAVSCSDFNVEDALAFNSSESVDWPGQVSLAGCDTTGVTRSDKLLLITPGRFYGHPNIQRGGRECAWIDPLTNVAADGRAPPQNYQPQVVAVDSPTTGLGVYRGNHFCGGMRGDVITARFDARGVSRVGVSAGRLKSAPTSISSGGGIAFAENAHGELLFVSLGDNQLSVLRPEVSEQDEVYIAGISPFRHGRRGGTPVTIGGMNFGSSPGVSVGGRDCRIIRSSEKEIECMVPPHTRGPKNVVVRNFEESETLVNGILYMNV